MRTISSQELSLIVGSNLTVSAFMYAIPALITYSILSVLHTESLRKTPEEQFNILNKKITDLEKAIAK